MRPVFISLLLGGSAALAAIFAYVVLPTHHAPIKTPASSDASAPILHYQCPMHPHITSQKPDKCTICGMALVPVRTQNHAATDPASATNVKLTSAIETVIGVGTSPVQIAPLRRTLLVAGIINDDETRHRILSARVPGRIEKLNVNQIGLEVTNGQPLATIYSPDVLTAQRLYVENLQAGAGVVSVSEIRSSREKLLALGLDEADIQHLEKTKKAESTLIVRTPFDGTVISRKAYEGQYVSVNDELFEIGDFSTLWFIFDAYERDLPLLALNQKVSVTLPSLPGETLIAPISFIDPNLNEATNTARVRVVLPNPKRRILYRQTANGTVHVETPPLLLIPRSAVLHTREKPVAYVAADNGSYAMRELRLGRVGDTEAEVIDGVKEGERVVTQAALLIDSQAQLTRVSPQNAATQTKPTAHVATNGDHGKTAQPTAASSHNDSVHATAALHHAAPDTALIHAAIALTEALADDDLPAYQKRLPALRDAVARCTGNTRKLLSPLAKNLIDKGDLKAIRRPFEPFSNALADLVHTQPEKARHAKIFQCRMSPVLGTARWLQKDAAVARNPFFGAEMLNCGDELK
ncbi:MAG: efflux RND transporter periplasmic adaptor subunit [Puniceicoccales bacterium]|jgi:Cu(I)/Ag(I) efflux system membrane fusion protein|nr:efflux RND transporter periplasmic adaptor subunit [Puniceicoccales bacterium]